MKRRLLLIIILLSSAAVLFTRENTIRLAVSPFNDSLTRSSEGAGAGKSVALKIEQLFSGAENFTLRPSGAIKGYLSGLARVQLGVSVPDSLKTSPTSLKVDYLTVGSVARFSDAYEVDARVVNISNWSIVYSKGICGASIDGAAEYISSEVKEKLSPQFLDEREKTEKGRSTLSVYRFRDRTGHAGRAGYSGAFSEMLNSELGGLKEVTTIERTFTKALINEKMLEMAGVIENDNSNETFNIRGIGFKVMGNFRVFPDVICLNYRVINTGSGAIVHMGSREIASSRGLRPSARVIAATIANVLGNKIGTLKLTTTPAGAEVFIDGKNMGQTPLLTSLPKGKHRIKITEPEYEKLEEVIEIIPRRIIEKKFVLEKKKEKEDKPDLKKLIMEKEAGVKKKAEEEKRREEERLKKEKEEKARLEEERLARAKAEKEAEAKREKERAGNIPTL